MQMFLAQKILLLVPITDLLR